MTQNPTNALYWKKQAGLKDARIAALETALKVAEEALITAKDAMDEAVAQQNRADALAARVEALEARVDDLSMLVRQLVHSLNKYNPGSSTATRAMDYLHRNCLQGSILRSSESQDAHDARVRREALEEAARIVHKTGHGSFTGMCRPVCLTCTMLDRLGTSKAAILGPAPEGETTP